MGPTMICSHDDHAGRQGLKFSVNAVQEDFLT